MNIADELRKLQDLHRAGALTDEEFATAKAAVLAGGSGGSEAAGEGTMREELEEIKLQNEVARLDREWEMERQHYMVAGRYGSQYVPSRGMSVLGGVFFAGFGLIWIVMAASMGGGFGGGFDLFPLFGVLFILFGVGTSIYSYTKATQYEEAYQAYQRRRAEVLAGRGARVALSAALLKAGPFGWQRRRPLRSARPAGGLRL
jgi:hypothetical protein